MPYALPGRASSLSFLPSGAQAGPPAWWGSLRQGWHKVAAWVPLFRVSIPAEASRRKSMFSLWFVLSGAQLPSPLQAVGSAIVTTPMSRFADAGLGGPALCPPHLCWGPRGGLHSAVIHQWMSGDSSLSSPASPPQDDDCGFAPLHGGPSSSATMVFQAWM